MTVNRRYVGAGGALAAVLLVFLWWGSSPDPAEESHSAETIEERSTKGPSTSLPRRHVHPEECESCPDTPRVEGGKRVPWSNARRDCQEFLVEAADAGNPDPDTSNLEDCGGLSPLHFAETPQQIQALLDAGADPNIQDLEGRTPLYLQIEKAMAMPSDEGALIVQKLLDAKADPWIKTNSGKLPYDIARSKNTSGARLIQVEKRFRDHLKDRGVTLEEAFEKNPALKIAMDKMKRDPQIASQTLATLMESMNRTH